MKRVQHSVNLDKVRSSHYVTNKSPCRAKQNVPVSTSFRFQVLQDLNAKDIYAVKTNTEISVCTACPNKKFPNMSTNSLHHSRERKCLPTTLAIEKQPLLAVEAKINFIGNKNKTGSFKRDLGVTKSSGYDFITTKSSQIQSQSTSIDSKVPSTASCFKDFSLSNTTHSVVDSHSN